MSDDFQEDLDFEAADQAAEGQEALIVDIDGYEGPMHLLLELARQQKVDLARISILQLAEQYLQFIKTAQDLRIELAADYLVMAAWLAYLKSRLILPKTDSEDDLQAPDEMAAFLAFRLQRLEAMRRASEGLLKLSQTQQNVFARGMPEGLRSRTSPLWEATLFDILEAYGQSRSRATISNHKLPTPSVMTLDDARSRLRRALNMVSNASSKEWHAFDELLPKTAEFDPDVPVQSVKASSLVAGLELAKLGNLELRQTGTFAPIYVRVANPKKDDHE